MGYRTTRTLYPIRFAPGHKLHGLNIMARSCPIGELVELGRVASTVKAAQGSGVLPVNEINRLLDVFGNSIKEWDLEDEDGNPVPPGRAGLEFLDLEDVMDVILKWAETIAQVSAPLDKRSIPSGTPQIPMEPMTADLVS
jgi:hypothetical protein